MVQAPLQVPEWAEAEKPDKLGSTVYTIGAGDVLRTNVYDHPDLSQEFTVSADGSLLYPLIGTVPAGGMTVRQLEEHIAQRLADGYVVNPQVTVTLLQYKSQQVYVLGAVKTPGPYALQRPSMFLEEILSEVGGPTPEAGLEVIVVRGADRGEAGGGQPGGGSSGPATTTRVDLPKLLAGELSQRIEVRHGDVISVPNGTFFYVSGEVIRPGRYRLEQDTTVFKAITVAGGITKFAARKQAIVHRVVDGQRRAFQARMEDLLQAEDVLEIPISLF
jgi:polysaccharide export outer membrane protein